MTTRNSLKGRVHLAPELGQHTEEVLLEAGLDWEAITRLREDGVT
jgi:crotonobetainyl-CoA:carnitine CoA-transferase CaiB-like acyl-CoA transferase